jgi:hypothetical protein
MLTTSVCTLSSVVKKRSTSHTNMIICYSYVLGVYCEKLAGPSINHVTHILLWWLSVSMFSLWHSNAWNTMLRGWDSFYVARQSLCQFCAWYRFLGFSSELKLNSVLLMLIWILELMLVAAVFALMWFLHVSCLLVVSNFWLGIILLCFQSTRHKQKIIKGAPERTCSLAWARIIFLE